MRTCFPKQALTAGCAAAPQESALKHILLVDDDAVFLASFAEMLRSLDGNYKISTAENGEQAAAIIKTVPINLLITDLRMPVMDGLELVLRIAENHPGIPMIVMSASENPRSIQELGARVRYFEKPVNIDDLLGTIRRLLLATGGPSH